MALKCKISSTTEATQTNPLDLATGSFPVAVSDVVSLTNGTGAGQADRMFTDRRTIAASANDDLDLAGGLTDPFGASITFAKVKSIKIKADAGNTNNVLVGGDATNTFLTWVVAEADALVLRPGARFELTAGQADATGYAVTASTGDLLRISNSGAGSSVTYEIMIIGTSA